MRAIQRYGGDQIAAIMADTNGPRAHHAIATSRSTTRRSTGVTLRLRQLLRLRRRARPADEPDRSGQRSRPVTVLGWQTADRLFGANVDPIDKIIQIEGVHFRVVGVSEKKGIDARPVAGQLRAHSARPVRDDVRLAPIARAHGQAAATSRNLVAAQDEATVALRGARRLKPKQPDNFGMFTSDTILGIYRSATNGIFAVLVGVVGLSLVVGGIVIMNIMLMVVTRADARDRPAQGARREAVATSCRRCSPSRSCCRCSAASSARSSGAPIALTMSTFTPIPASVEVWSVVLGIGITALVGLFFGLYPASRAARSRSDRSAETGMSS